MDDVLTSHLESDVRPISPPYFLLVVVIGMLCLGALARGARDLMVLKLPGNDDYMHLVQLRDWLSGKSWWDVDQARLGLIEQGDIHFSRLPDLLMAPFVLCLAPFIGDANAERFMLAVYPLTLLAFLIAILMFIAVEIGGRENGRRYGFATILVTVAALPIAAQFAVGSIDHHTVQLVLTSFSLLAIVKGLALPKWGIAAAAANILMLMVGAEAAPYVAATAIAIGCNWLLAARGDLLKYYGAGLVIFSIMAIPIAVPPSDLMVRYCDAYSIVFASVAMLAGIGALGLFATTSYLPNVVYRAIAATGLGVILVAILGVSFPECRAGPLAALDPLVVDLWLSNVIEARDVGNVIVTMPAQFAGRLMFPIVGSFVALFLCIRSNSSDQRIIWLIYVVFLVIGCLTAFWQLRAAVFANVFAVLPVAIVLANLRQRVSMQSGRSVAAFFAGCVFLSPAAYSALAHLDTDVNKNENFQNSNFSKIETEQIDNMDIGALSDCDEPASYRALSDLKEQRLFTPIDIGPEILTFTSNSVSAAPYHRNNRALKATIQAFTAPSAEAFQIIAESDASYLVFCPGAPETNIYVKASAGGLANALRENNAPSWLERVAIPGTEPLHVYRVLGK